MKYLVDTYVFFWAILQDEKFSVKVKRIVEDASKEILVSQISLLELAIKRKVGKLPELKVDLSAVLNEIPKAGFTLLPLKNEHLIAYFNYAHFSDEHKDPFDRLLLVTADVEKATFITKDEKFEEYKDRMSIVW